MSEEIRAPKIDVSGWESVLIHISNEVTATNIKEIINKDISKMGKQKVKQEEITQEKYDHRYIKALFRRIKTEFDQVLVGTQEVDYHIDGANSCFNVDGGLDCVHSKVNNLEDLDGFLRAAIGEHKFKQLLDDIVAKPDDIDIHTNMVIHELKQNGVEDMIDNTCSSHIKKHYDEWGGDYGMDNSWWQPYTERSLRMAIIIHEIVLDYLEASPNFDPNNLWASLDSDDVTFMLGFEYEGDNGVASEIIDSHPSLAAFIKLYFEKYR